MPKYTVYLETSASTSVTVEAADEESAYEEALCADMPTICAQCSGWGQSHSLELGDEWDLPEREESFTTRMNRYVELAE